MKPERYVKFIASSDDESRELTAYCMYFGERFKHNSVRLYLNDRRRFPRMIKGMSSIINPEPDTLKR